MILVAAAGEQRIFFQLLINIATFENSNADCGLLPSVLARALSHHLTCRSASREPLLPTRAHPTWTKSKTSLR